MNYPPISDAHFCARCLKTTNDLTPFRRSCLSARCATPKLCPDCLPVEERAEAQYLRASEEAKSRMSGGTKANSALEELRSIEDEAVRRPLLKLLRSTAPAPGRVPVFTPEVLHDAASDMKRSWRQAMNWRRDNYRENNGSDNRRAY